MALGKGTRDTEIQTRRTILYKSAQFLGHSDDLDLISKTVVDLKKALLSLVQAAEEMRLKIKEYKTKYVVILLGLMTSRKWEVLSIWSKW